MEPSAQANDLIPVAAFTAAASLLIAALTFSHLLLPLLAVLAIANVVAFMAMGFGRLINGRARRR